MRFLALALLLASPLFGQMQISDMEFQDVTITSAVSSAPAEDWSASFQAVYDFEASGDPWANNADTIGGSGCDMTIETGTPTRETGVYKHGTASALLEDSGGEGEDIDQSCNETGSDLDDASVTWGAWVYSAQDSTGEWMHHNTAGLTLRRDITGDGRPLYQVGDTVGGGTTSHYGASNSFPITTWVHAVGTYDYGNNEIDSYENGSSTVSATAHTYGLAAGNLKIGGVVGATDKYIDEAFVYQGELSADAVCRIASCGIDGTLCTCNGTAWVDDGRHTTMSLTCTLPTNCNDAAP